MRIITGTDAAMNLRFRPFAAYLIAAATQMEHLRTSCNRRQDAGRDSVDGQDGEKKRDYSKNYDGDEDKDHLHFAFAILISLSMFHT